MPIIKTLGQYFSQKDEFKQYEKEKEIKEEQRKQYLEKKQFTPEEIANAKKLGTKIIDTVDIMDKRSEEACQDVELITQPVPSFASLFGMFGGLGISGLLGKSFFKKQKSKETDFTKFANSIMDKLTDEKQREDFRKLTKSDFKLKQKDIISLGFLKELDETGNKLTDSAGKSVKTLEKKLLEYSKEVGAQKYAKKIFSLAKYPMLGFVGAFIGASVWVTKLQVQSSRIARFQGREKLNDDKNFVVYTDEQLKQAEEIAKKMPEQKEKKHRGYFGRLGKLIKDNKAAEAEAKEDKYRLNNLDLSTKEVEDIKKQQKILNRTVVAINNKAETYSENMETAANVIFGGSILGGAVIGKGVQWILNRFTSTDKLIDGYAKKLENEVKKANCSPFKKGMQEVLSDPSTLKALKSGTRKFGLPIIGGFLASLATGPIVLMLTKNASRAGRYSAKKELEKDPTNFIYVDEKETEQNKDVKVKKQGPLDKFISMFKIVPKSVAEVFEYNKYKKTTVKDKEKLAEAIKQVEVTPEQLKEAKKLKVGLFNTFEEVDENTQRFSEDTETVTDVVQQLTPLGIMASMAIAPIIIINGVLKGKITKASAIKKVTSMIADSSKILQSKFFKKQVGQVSDNVIGSFDKEYNKLVKNNYYFKNLSKEIGEGGEALLEKLVTKQKITQEEAQKLTNVFSNKEKRFETTYHFNNLMKEFDVDAQMNIPWGSTIDEESDIIKTAIDKLSKNIDDVNPENKNIFSMDYIKANLLKDTPVGEIDTAKIREYLNSFTEEIKEMDDNSFQAGLKELLVGKAEETIGAQLPQQAMTVIDPLLKNIKKDDVLKIVESLKTIDIDTKNVNIIEELTKAIQKQPEIMEKFKALGIQNLQGLEKCNDFSELIPKLITNNPAMIQKAQKTVGATLDIGITSIKNIASEEQIKKFISENIPMLEGLSKDDTIKLANNMLKIFNNIPAEEIASTVSKLMNYQKQNPAKFELIMNSMMKDPTKLPQLTKEALITPDIQKIAAIAGGSYVAANTFVAYLVAAFCADLQLKAGRLGSMNAVKSLNAETDALQPTKTEKQPETKTSETVKRKSLVDEYLNRKAV